MLSAQCQSDEDWHAGKLSFISMSVHERRAATLQRPFSPLHPPPSPLQKAGHYSCRQKESGREGDRRDGVRGERESEREREGG